jgi:prevent-host-death family protein
MRSVGVRELKAETSRILRAVRDEGEEVAVTHRGETIAYLVPARPTRRRSRRTQRISSDLDRLAREIRRRWPRGVGAVEALRDVRR